MSHGTATPSGATLDRARRLDRIVLVRDVPFVALKTWGLLRGVALLLALAEQLRADVESDLVDYDIQDTSTLQDFYADLGSVTLLQQRWQDYDCWSTLVLKNTDEEVEILTKAPVSGIWHMEKDDTLSFVRRSWDWSNAASEQEAFFLRILSPGEYIYKGADLGIVLLRGRVQDDDGVLLPRVHQWVSALKNEFESVEPAANVTLPQQQGLLYKIN